MFDQCTILQPNAVAAKCTQFETGTKRCCGIRLVSRLDFSVGNFQKAQEAHPLISHLSCARLTKFPSLLRCLRGGNLDTSFIFLDLNRSLIR